MPWLSGGGGASVAERAQGSTDESDPFESDKLFSAVHSLLQVDTHTHCM